MEMGLLEKATALFYTTSKDKAFAIVQDIKDNSKNNQAKSSANDVLNKLIKTDVNVSPVIVITTLRDLLAKSKYSEWQTDVPGVGEHHRWHERLERQSGCLGHRQGQQARAQHDGSGPQGEPPVLSKLKILAGQDMKYQRRQEDRHVDLVRRRHVRLTPAAVKVADGNDRKDREDDAEKADDEHDVTGAGKGRLCGIDAASHKAGVLQWINDCMKMSSLYLISLAEQPGGEQCRITAWWLKKQD